MTFADFHAMSSDSDHRPLCYCTDISRGGVEDITFEAKDSKNIPDQDQGPTFPGQTLSRPRTGMVEAKA